MYSDDERGRQIPKRERTKNAPHKYSRNLWATFLQQLATAVDLMSAVHALKLRDV